VTCGQTGPPNPIITPRMLSHSPAIAAPTPSPAPPPPPARGDIRSTLEECLTLTANALHQSAAVEGSVLSSALTTARAIIDGGRPADLIEVVARSLGHQGADLARAVLEMSDRVAAALYPPPPVIPFGAKLIGPATFYEAFEPIRQLGRALLSPVLFAEDTDAIGTASINPVAARILAEEISSAVACRLGIRPFITVARLGYDDWVHLTRKHFQL
jgi:hypothetical protein